MRDVTIPCGEQVLLPPAEGLLGSVVLARIVAASRWSVSGEVVPVVQQTSTAAQAESPFRVHSPADNSRAADTIDCNGVEQPDTSIAVCGKACDCDGAATCQAATVDGTDVRLPSPGSSDKASQEPGTAQVECSENVSSAGHTGSDREPIPAQVRADGQQAALAAEASACSASTSGAAEVQSLDSQEAAVSDSALAGAMAATASAVTNAASAATSYIQQRVRSSTAGRGSRAESALQTTGNKEDIVDTLLAFGVVLGLLGVLVVSAADLLNSFVRS